ncbi:aminoglycoside adenylyltransferase family protein [Proteus terrae]|uniref:aminoglycoside adenylyltransferase family protein n=1 Tax=Proteus terrae TaxID=1574161 RepID=UPI0013A53093|nr:aminoglycoside adenylyltransferase family protein [Proteus terrae]MCT8265360.1 aminoglycoside adenylyltransferase family protein [Proteus terrae]
MDALFQIQQALNSLKRIFRDNLDAIYLHGSSVSGGLKPTSDIDLLVIVKAALSKDEKKLLIEDLLATSGRYPYDKLGRRPLEIAIFVGDQLQSSQYPARCEFIYGEWLRDTFEQGISSVEHDDPEYTLMLAQAKKDSKLLWGDSFILPEIGIQQIRKALLDSLPNLISSIEGDERNVVLTLARMWFTMSSGKFVSKDVAANWSINKIPNEFIEIITVARDEYLYGTNVEWTKYNELLPLIVDYFSAQIKGYIFNKEY